MINDAARQERRALRLPGALLAGSRGRGREGAQGRGRDHVATSPSPTPSRTSRPTSRRSRATPTSCSSRRRSRATRRRSRASSPSRARRPRSSAATARTTPASFKAAGSYVSNFAPQITSIAADKAIIAAWKKDNPGKAVGSFGPPTYGAVQVILQAHQGRLRQGQGQDRQARRGDPERQARSPSTPAGSSAASSPGRRSTPTTRTPRKFYIMQIQSERLVQGRQLGESTQLVRPEGGPVRCRAALGV